MYAFCEHIDSEQAKRGIITFEAMVAASRKTEYYVRGRLSGSCNLFDRRFCFEGVAMGVRKSKKIGTIVKGYIVLDSKHVGRDTQFHIECQKCGAKFWKSSGFLKSKAVCPHCSGGKVDRNAEGYRDERLYKHYKMIVDRIKSHDRYRDVKMCDEWFYDYTKFREWALANGYEEGLTIDRIDNARGYEPSNCRWATMAEQANNRSSNIIVTYRGDTGTVANLARKYGKQRGVIYQRLRSGWSVEDAFDKPIDMSKWSAAKKEKAGVCLKS